MLAEIAKLTQMGLGEKRANILTSTNDVMKHIIYLPYLSARRCQSPWCIYYDSRKERKDEHSCFRRRSLDGKGRWRISCEIQQDGVSAPSVALEWTEIQNWHLGCRGSSSVSKFSFCIRRYDISHMFLCNHRYCNLFMTPRIELLHPGDGDKEPKCKPQLKQTQKKTLKLWPEVNVFLAHAAEETCSSHPDWLFSIEY